MKTPNKLITEFTLIKEDLISSVMFWDNLFFRTEEKCPPSLPDTSHLHYILEMWNNGIVEKDWIFPH